MEGQSTCPDRGLFRIIGSIYEENADTNLLKVIKANNLTDGATSSFSYDYTSSGSNSNIWSSTTSGTNSGATLMQLLNGIYLTRGTGNYYNNSTTATVVNFGSTGLTDVAQNLINTGNNNLSKYYLGRYSSSSQKTEAIYLAERGNTTSSGSALYWDGKVGLMYASDYGYAAGSSCAMGTNLADYSNSCYQRDWLHNTSDYHWTMSPSLTGTNLVWVVYNLANVRVDRAFYSSYSVYPVFYLDKDVYVVSGTGSSMDPYILSK